MKNVIKNKTTLRVVGNLTRAANAASNQRFAVPLVIIALVAIMGFSMAACGGDDDGGGGGGLKGTSWSRSDKDSGGQWDFTNTIKFTSDTEMTYTHKGWGKVSNQKKNYNDVTKGTYTYYPKDKKGVINCSALFAGTFPFSIDGNKLNYLAGSGVYTKD